MGRKSASLEWPERLPSDAASLFHCSSPADGASKIRPTLTGSLAASGESHEQTLPIVGTGCRLLRPGRFREIVPIALPEGTPHGDKGLPQWNNQHGGSPLPRRPRCYHCPIGRSIT